MGLSDGEACRNQVESFFSRPRRAEIGTHLHLYGEQYFMAANAARRIRSAASGKGIGSAA
jgi:hypothetical protein